MNHKNNIYQLIMAKRNVIIFLIFVSSCLLFSPAQMLLAAKTGNSDTPLTLGEAITMGLANNPRITAVQSQVDASEARVSQARSCFFPRLDISQSFNRTNPMWAFGTKLNQEITTSEDFDPERLNVSDEIDNFAATVSVSVPVYDRGENWIELNQAKLDHEAFSLSADRIRQQVIVDIVISYFDALLAHENLLVVVHQTLETAKANLKMVRSRFESGLVVKSDLLRAEVRIAELEQQRLQAQSQVDVANTVLNAAMGIEIDRSFQLQTLLERTSEKPDLLTTWISTSLENRPDLKKIRLQEIIAQKEVKKAKAAHLPGLYLLGSYDINSEDFGETGNNYTVGAIMRFNLFSGFDAQSKGKEADVRRTQTMAQQLEQDIKVETRQAFLRAQSAYGCIGVAKAAVAQADEGLRVARDHYENGLSTIVNLLDAEVALQQARNNYLRSLHDFKVAMARLNLAAGTVDETFVITQVVR